MGALAGSKDVDWANWHVFFGDERNVPHSSPDSTIKGAREGFLNKVPIPEANIHAIREGLPVEVRTIVDGRIPICPPITVGSHGLGLFFARLFIQKHLFEDFHGKVNQLLA